MFMLNIRLSFKIRSPMQNQTIYKDKRKNEKGFALINKSKRYINALCKKLDIVPFVKKKESCDAIEHRLLENEYKERMKNSNIKWVYHYFE